MKLLGYLGLIIYQIDITFIASGIKLLIEIFVEIESTITNFLDLVNTVVKHRGAKKKER